MKMQKNLFIKCSAYGLATLLALSGAGIASSANAAPTPKPTPSKIKEPKPVASGQALTDSGLLRNDPNRPVGLIAAGLNITAAQFVLCFDKVSPAIKGSRPEGTKVLKNKSLLLPCLQKFNPQITDSSLNTVMDKYRPGGHEAQTPPK